MPVVTPVDRLQVLGPHQAPLKTYYRHPRLVCQMSGREDTSICGVGRVEGLIHAGGLTLRGRF